MVWKNHALTDEQDVLLRTGSPEQAVEPSVRLDKGSSQSILRFTLRILRAWCIFYWMPCST